MIIKFLDLDKEYEDINYKDILEPIFTKKNFINGKEVSDFESQFSKYIGSKFSIGVSSGTDALWASILSLEIKNPVVLTTPYTFISTVEVPIRYGSKVIFCDVDETFNIDIQKCKDIIRNNHIDIFIPVHLFGLPCNLDEELLDLCRDKGVKIIEDAAQAFGSKLKDKYVGNIGNIGCFSFFPAKNLGCAGDGGMITTNDENIYNKIKMIRNHGSSKKYNHIMHGGNFRLDTIQAAILIEKLKYVDKFIHNRRRTAELYNKNLCKNIIPDNGKIYGAFHTYNQYVIKVKDRDSLVSHLNRNNIPTAIYYPCGLNDQKVYQKIKFNNNLYASNKCAKENIAIPVAYLNEVEVYYIIDKIKEFVK